MKVLERLLGVGRTVSDLPLAEVTDQSDLSSGEVIPRSLHSD